jgi:hypothetical protein
VACRASVALRHPDLELESSTAIMDALDFCIQAPFSEQRLSKKRQVNKFGAPVRILGVDTSLELILEA